MAPFKASARGGAWSLVLSHSWRFRWHFLAAIVLAAGAGMRARTVCMLSPQVSGSEVPFAHHLRASDDADSNPDASLDVVYVSGLPRHLRSSLRSLCAFWRRPAEGVSVTSGGTVHVIVPDRMISYFEAAAPSLAACVGGTPPLRLRMWPESTVVPAFAAGGAGARASGTVKQMMLKLAAAYIVNTPFYLVMDSDVYARRPWSVSDLLVRGRGTSAGSLRARTGLDTEDGRFVQEPSWLRESARALRTGLIDATDAYCSASGARAGPWFAKSAGAAMPSEAPFALLSSSGSATAPTFGVCNFGRARATHVTPMVLAAAVVREILVPRLEAGVTLSAGGASGSQPWVSALLAYHSSREDACWARVLPGMGGRFYSWTEYGLYFAAAVASGAMDQYHTFAAGGITSLRRSMMLPSEYEAADWPAIFADDATDDAPFFIVHSWFGKPVQRTEALLTPHVAGLLRPGDVDDAQPSPLPLY